MAICITVAPCGRDKPENGSKCCTAFLFPPLSALFFCFFPEMCLVKLSNTANQEFSLSPAVSLDPKLPFSTSYSRTLCVVQQLLLSTVVFPIMCVLNPAYLTSDLEQHHTVL